MADEQRKGGATVPSIQCDRDTKAKFQRAATTLKWSMQEVAELAGDLLLKAIEGEESPEQRKARLLSGSSSTRVRQGPNNSVTPVAS